MRKVRLVDLKDGMVVAENVYDPGDDLKIPLVRSGVPLNAEFIDGLKKRDIVWIYVELPKDYRGSPGETIELQSLKNDIVFDGKVKILDGLAPQLKIEARERVLIQGDVSEGCVINCTGGPVVLVGSLKGSQEEPVQITSAENIVVENVLCSKLKADGNVKVDGDIEQSSVNSKGEIVVAGSSKEAVFYCQSSIMIEGYATEGTAFTANPVQCQEALQELLKLDATVSGLLKEQDRHRNVIELIKRLGMALDTMPAEKRVELAHGVKRFKEIQEEVLALRSRKGELKDKYEKLLTEKRIMVAGELMPGVTISICNNTLTLTGREQHRAFYVKDNMVVSSEKFD